MNHIPEKMEVIALVFLIYLFGFPDAWQLEEFLHLQKSETCWPVQPILTESSVKAELGSGFPSSFSTGHKK